MVTPSPATTATRLPTPTGEAGYNMVVLMVLVTVLGILVAAALPAWSNAIQREKEEELIFRGLQYAEAIRVFQQRYGRPPNTLDELVKVEPRCIRRLWEDPLTGKNDWGLLFADPQAARFRPAGDAGAVAVPGVSSGSRDKVTTGPIVGVYSLAGGDSILTFFDKNAYSEWQFSAQLVTYQMQNGQNQAALALGGGPPGQGGLDPNGRQGRAPPGLPDLSSRWLGRAWPPGLQQQLQQQPQGGSMPGQDATAQPQAAGKP